MTLPKLSLYPFLHSHNFFSKHPLNVLSLDGHIFWLLESSGLQTPWGWKVQATGMLARTPWRGDPHPGDLCLDGPSLGLSGSSGADGGQGAKRSPDRPWTLKKNQYSSRS